MRVVVVVAVAGLVVLSPRTSGATEISDSAKAEELIRKANEYRRLRQDERALPLFREAYEISRTPRSAAQLGLAEQALGYWDAAHEHLSEALTSVSHHPWVDKNRRTLEEALRSVKTHVAALAVDGTPAGADVLLNRKLVGTLPLAAPVTVNEGRIEVEVRAPGHKSDRRVLTLNGNATTRVTINLERNDPASTVPEPVPARVPPPAAVKSEEGIPERMRPAPTPAPAPAPTPVDQPPAWRRVLPWSLAAGAVAAVAFGVWQQVSSSNALDRFDGIAACGASLPMRGADPRCAGLYDDFAGARTRARVGYGIAGALGAGAAALFIWNAVTPSPPVSADVALGPGELQLRLRASF